MAMTRQEAVDWAKCLSIIGDLVQQGLARTVLTIHAERCRQLIADGEREGLRPSDAAVERFTVELCRHGMLELTEAGMVVGRDLSAEHRRRN